MSATSQTVQTDRSSTVSRAAANRVQTKLSVGRSNDSHEQEADRVADVVVRGRSVAGPAATSGESISSASAASVQRAPTISRLANSAAQRKLQRREVEEREKQKQEKVQRQEEEPQTKLQRQEEEEEAQPKLQLQEEEPQTKLQRQEEEEEPVQAKKVEARANVRDKKEFPVLNQVEPTLFSNKGKGEKLDDETRVSMETGFGADFSGVRIHQGGDAEVMSRDLKAQAFTHGKDVFFNTGKYEPDTVRGKMLLAHELTHVVQQGAAEQKVPENKIQQNNAKRNAPPPEPADKETQKAEQQAASKLKENEPKPNEAPVAADKAKVATESKGEESKEGAEKRDAQTGKVKPVKLGKKKPKGKGKSKGAGGGVGAFLRKTTKDAFEAKKTKVSKLAENEKNKETAEIKLTHTEKAVVPPVEEGQSRAKASQVESVEQAKEPQPDERKAKEKFNKALENAVPSTLEAVDKFKDKGKGRAVGNVVKGVVTADTQAVKGTYQEIENPPEPAPLEQEPETLPEIEQAPETETLNMGDGVVGEIQAEHTDLSNFENKSDEMLKKEGIKDEHLDMVDEGDLAEASKDRKNVKDTVKKAPKEAKKVEQQEKQKVSKELTKEEQAGKQKMQAERKKELMATQNDQKKTKSTIEQKRQQVTEQINGIYKKANDTVKLKLENLEKQSLAAFDAGEKKATKAFEDNVKRRINAFKKRRYDRFGGSLLWAKDKLFGMDELPEVKGIFDSEKSRFITKIDELIKKITAENKRVIQECKEVVATARKAIEKFVQGLGPELRNTGQAALKEMKGKLDALDKKINDKEKELKKKLEAKREAAIKAIEQKIEAMKEAMSGLISKLGNLLLNAMLKFFQWALKKAGYSSDQLMGVINKGKAVIKKIVTDPVAFIGNIIKAVKKGIGQFVTNIKKHLISGLIGWLTGAMSDVPITLPEKWDMKGILHLVLQILGLTWDRIRTKLVKRLGEKVVKMAETSVTVVKTLIKEGPIGLWNMIKEKAAEIKQQVMEGIRNWVITQVVKQAVIKLVSFLNPAGAILQAILAIYNTIMFFVENWQRIANFVSTVFNSISDIANGKLSAAAQAVENAMAMTIPIILNFLARLLGLSGIGKAVSKIIGKIRKPIDKVVNKVVDKVAKLSKKLMKKGKAGAKKAADKVKGLIFPKQPFKSGKEKHAIQVKKVGGKSVIVVRSVERNIKEFAADAEEKALNFDKAEKNEVGRLTNQLKDKYKIWPKLKEETKAQQRTKRGKYRDIGRLMIKIAQLTPATEEIPESDKPIYTPESGPGGISRAKSAEIRTLTMKNIPQGENTNSRENIPGINTSGYEKASQYRLHLIHHGLGGLAASNTNNLVAGSKTTNERMRGSVENITLEAVGKRGKQRSGIISKGMPRLLNYKTTVTYDDKAPFVAKRITTISKEKKTGAIIGKFDANNY